MKFVVEIADTLWSRFKRKEPGLFHHLTIGEGEDPDAAALETVIAHTMTKGLAKGNNDNTSTDLALAVGRVKVKRDPGD